MSLAYVIVDVFTGTPLQGNQLAVSEDGPALSDDQMQRLAREMDLPGPSSCFRPRTAMLAYPSSLPLLSWHRPRTDPRQTH